MHKLLYETCPYCVDYDPHTYCATTEYLHVGSAICLSWNLKNSLVFLIQTRRTMPVMVGCMLAIRDVGQCIVVVLSPSTGLDRPVE